MSLKETINAALTRTTGYRLQRAERVERKRPRRGAGAGDRLVERPAFVLCTLRSGSTLLRVLLDSHSRIHSPHELHLRYVTAGIERKWADRSMKELGLDEHALRFLLWDRILHRELDGSGKELIVDKTPNNVFIADELRECWPDARFIFLLRHPGAIARSRQAYKGDDDGEDNVALIRRYCDALERARQTFDGHTVRYEELTARPGEVLEGVCRFLGVPFEPSMLEYGRFQHGRYKAGLGDWSDNIRTGAIQAPEPPPPDDEVPEELRPIAATWGYLAAGSASGASTPA